MMVWFKRLLMVLLIAIVVTGLSGCEEGPMERAGKAVDEAVEDAGEAMEDAGEAVEDAMEKQKKKN